MVYKVHENLKPLGLSGISDEQINDHWGLYVAYVNQANALKDELSEARKGKTGDTFAYADRRRRLGFELNGIVLHEYYFGNLKASVDINEAKIFIDAVTKTYGSFKAWKTDFINTGKSRSIGWAICAIDSVTGDINNHFIQLHEDGNIAGYSPLLVMDVWEHAYMVDHKASGRPNYINTFFDNINWEVVEQRHADATSKLASKRV